MSTLQPNETKPAPRRFLTNLGRIAGAVGVVFLVSAPFTWFLSDELGPLVWGKLALGLVLVGVYLATNADFFSRLAGARSTGLFVMSGATVILVVGIVGVANYLVYKHPKEIDVTRVGLFTLSEQTQGVLGRLKSEVKAYAFYSPMDSLFERTRETLSRYRQRSAQFAFDMVDPQSRPDLVEKYQITERGPRIVVTADTKEARAKDVSEEELTNAIIKVAEQTTKAVYFLTGHGETDINDEENAEGYKQMADAIRAEGYRVETFSFLRPETAPAPGTKVKLDTSAQGGAKIEVPNEAAVLVVAGARSKLMQPEVDAIASYLERGGRLLALLDPDTDTGLEPLLRKWRIEVRKDLIVDPNPLNRLLGLGPVAPMLQPTQEPHATTKDLTTAAVIVSARSLVVGTGGEPGVEATPLMETGPSAWGETNVKGETVEKSDKDNPGPLVAAIAATKSIPSTQADRPSGDARVVAYGDSDWVNNRYLHLQGNTDLFLNTVNWVAAEEAKITIRPKARAASQLYLTGEQMARLTFFSLDILPVLLVAMGLAIVLIRRQR